MSAETLPIHIRTASDPPEVREVRACQIVRRMRGGSQAALVLTDNGWYVVKWKQNPQHRRILINEAAGAELFRYMGIASPEWAVVRADNAFLQTNPDARIFLHKGSIPVEAGRHFGSRFPGDPEAVAVYDFLPVQLTERVTNLDSFVRAVVFDCWVDNNDGRQAIFFKAGNRRLTAHMIDNGFAFGFDGAEWRMRDRPQATKGYPLLSGLYRSPATTVQLESAIAAVQALTANDLDRIRDKVPAEWMEDDQDRLARVFGELLRRARRLPDLVAAARAYLS